MIRATKNTTVTDAGDMSPWELAQQAGQGIDKLTGGQYGVSEGLAAAAGASPASMAGPWGMVIGQFAAAAGIKPEGSPPTIHTLPAGGDESWALGALDPRHLAGYIKWAVGGDTLAGGYPVPEFANPAGDNIPENTPRRSQMRDANSKVRNAIRTWIALYPEDAWIDWTSVNAMQARRPSLFGDLFAVSDLAAGMCSPMFLEFVRYMGQRTPLKDDAESGSDSEERAAFMQPSEVLAILGADTDTVNAAVAQAKARQAAAIKLAPIFSKVFAAKKQQALAAKFAPTISKVFAARAAAAAAQKQREHLARMQQQARAQQALEQKKSTGTTAVVAVGGLAALVLLWKGGML